jgi:hypothetical protein
MIHTRLAGAKSHRDRKNGASREEWQARKAAANAARPAQEVYISRLEVGQGRYEKTIRVRE